MLHHQGFEIFLDLKLHDIPNTVKKSIEGLVSLPIDMMTIHTSGGLRDDESCKESCCKTLILKYLVLQL